MPRVGDTPLRTEDLEPRDLAMRIEVEDHPWLIFIVHATGESLRTTVSVSESGS